MSVTLCEVEDCTRVARVLLEFPDKTRAAICDNHAIEAVEWGREHGLAIPIVFYERIDPRRMEEYVRQTAVGIEQDKNTKRPRLFGPTGRVQK